MGTIVNGVNLDDCESVKVNGHYAQSIVVNGTEVWHESCFDGIWTGSTLCGYRGCVDCGSTKYIGSYDDGLSTSGHNARLQAGQYNIPFCFQNPISYGGWITADSHGIGHGTSVYSSQFGSTTKVVFSGNKMNYSTSVSNSVFGDIFFNTVDKFSGKTGTNGTHTGGWAYDISFSTSGGNLRHQILGSGCGYDLSTYGSWITIN